MLKFLAAHRFEGMPPQLQVLHIEQEVAGGELSVLETVLATDIERNALLAEQAELEFKEIGDRIRTVLSAADGALSLYGVPGREEDAVAKTIQVFRSKGSPATNNPDDIALLQEI